MNRAHILQAIQTAHRSGFHILAVGIAECFAKEIGHPVPNFDRVNSEQKNTTGATSQNTANDK